jgi:hypothetical protein
MAHPIPNVSTPRANSEIMLGVNFKNSETEMSLSTRDGGEE